MAISASSDQLTADYHDKLSNGDPRFRSESVIDAGTRDVGGQIHGRADGVRVARGVTLAPGWVNNHASRTD
jgi:hypothetical protein